METNTQINIPNQSLTTPATNPITPIVPVGAKIISVLLYIASIFFIFFGIIAVAFSSLYVQFFSLSGLTGLASFGIGNGLIPGVAAAVWGVIIFIAGRGLWTGKQWGRILAITISALYIIFGLIGIVMLGGANYISLIINLVIILYLLFGKNIFAAFQNGKSIGVAAILVVLAFAAYTTMEYPIYFAPTNTISPVDYNKLMQYHGTQTNHINSQNTNPTPNPTFNQNGQAPTTPNTTPQITSPPPPVTNGQVYTNTKYNFQLTFQQAYTVTEYPNSANDGFAFTGSNNQDILWVTISPANNQSLDALTTQSLKTVTNQGISVQQSNTTIAGGLAIYANINSQPPQEEYFLIHNGNFYIISQGVTAAQFAKMVESLKFTQ